MIFLTVILSVAALIVLIMNLRISFRVRAGDALRLTLGCGPYRADIFPAREKTVRLRDYRIGRFGKRRVKKKAVNKAAPKKSKSAAPPKEKSNVTELIGKITDVAKTFLTRFGRYLRIEVRELALSIGTGDAASTAIIYGAAVAAAENLCFLLENSGTLHVSSADSIAIIPDFCADKTTVRVDIRFSIKVWQLLNAGIRAAVVYLKSPDAESDEIME